MISYIYIYRYCFSSWVQEQEHIENIHNQGDNNIGNNFQKYIIEKNQIYNILYIIFVQITNKYPKYYNVFLHVNFPIRF